MSRSILLLGTNNKSRSIMAEAYINHVAGDIWRAHSAGSEPADIVHPLARKVLSDAGIVLPDDVTPKSRDVFSDPSAPVMDVVVSLCAEAADERLLNWPGAPRLLHWPVPDPVDLSYPGEEEDALFRAVLDLIRDRADRFLADHRAASGGLRRPVR
jgi:arsenate reductase